jgi:hypothetical protein
MTVYVDDMQRQARVGRLNARWSHLTADTREELLAFAAQLGLQPEWRQSWDNRRFHFDVTEPVRLRALQLGAHPITYPWGIAALLERRRLAEGLATPANLPRGYERRYTSIGRVAHAVDIDGPHPAYAGARCHLDAPLGGWLGTGSQAEYERAAALPLCRLCRRYLDGAAR